MPQEVAAVDAFGTCATHGPIVRAGNITELRPGNFATHCKSPLLVWPGILFWFLEFRAQTPPAYSLG